MKIAFFGVKEEDKKEFFQSSLKQHQVVFLDQNIEELPNFPQKDFEILSIFVQSKITPEIIDLLPNLKMIAIRSTGFDNVDINYAKQKNIVVCNVPAYGSHTVAEFTFGLILSLSRKIPQAILKIKSKMDWSHEGLEGFDLYGKTLGVIGTGKIGVNVIKISKGFGMSVLAFDVYPNEEISKTLGYQYLELEDLLSKSDIVTIHVPSNPKTKHLINQENIFKIKKGALLINTARGDVVETEALYQAISKNHLAGAGLDVIEDEAMLNQDALKQEFEPAVIKNILEDNLLTKNPNVIITPHTAFYTKEAEQSIMQTTVDNILNFINNSPQNIVNK